LGVAKNLPGAPGALALERRQKTASKGNWGILARSREAKGKSQLTGLYETRRIPEKASARSDNRAVGMDEVQNENGSLAYAVQKHMATNLHYDFRLEWHGVLLSWAIPKGPSLDPAVKRLAMQTEDHPVEYSGFEGVISQRTIWSGDGDVMGPGKLASGKRRCGRFFAEGRNQVLSSGQQIQGAWVLVRTRGFGKNPSASAWLLIKHRDQYASTQDVTQEEPRSIASRRLLRRSHGTKGRHRKSFQGRSVRRG